MSDWEIFKAWNLLKVCKFLGFAVVAIVVICGVPWGVCKWMGSGYLKDVKKLPEM